MSLPTPKPRSRNLPRGKPRPRESTSWTSSLILPFPCLEEIAFAPAYLGREYGGEGGSPSHAVPVVLELTEVHTSIPVQPLDNTRFVTENEAGQLLGAW